MPATGLETIRFLRLSRFQRHRVLAHLLRLDPEDRATRFGGPARDEDVRRYWERIDWARTLMLGCEIDGELRAIGELKAVGAAGWGPVAEVAVTVERPFQGRRIGSELLRRLATLARNRGVRTLCSICLARNRRVPRMVLHHDADLTPYNGELEGQIRLPWPSTLSLAQEVIDEVAGVVPTALAPVAARHRAA